MVLRPGPARAIPHGAGDRATASADAPVTGTLDVLRRGPRRGGGFAQFEGVKAPANPARRGDARVSRQTADWRQAPQRLRESTELSHNRKGTFLVLSGLASLWPPRPPLAQPAHGRRNGRGHCRDRRRRRGDRRRCRRPRVPEQRRGLPRSRLRHDRGLPGPHRRDRDSSRSPAAARSSAPPRASSRRATSPSRSTIPAATAGAPARASTSRPTSAPATRSTISFNGHRRGRHDRRQRLRHRTIPTVTRQHPDVVKGYAGPGVNQAQMEQRIINPDLVDTEIGKRDIRALPGPLDAGAQGRLLVLARRSRATTFTATYVFTDRGQRARSRRTPTSASARCRGRKRTPTATVRA